MQQQKSYLLTLELFCNCSIRFLLIRLKQKIIIRRKKQKTIYNQDAVILSRNKKQKQKKQQTNVQLMCSHSYIHSLKTHTHIQADTDCNIKTLLMFQYITPKRYMEYVANNFSGSL